MSENPDQIYVEVYYGAAYYISSSAPHYADGVTVVEVPASLGVKPGWVFDVEHKTFSAPPPPPVLVPEVLSRRQFFQQLADDGDITQDEALAAVMTGAPPAKIDAAIKALPAAQQFPTRMLVSGAADFFRSNPTAISLGAALGKDASGLDALWIAAAQL